MSNVNINWITFEQGVERIRRAVGKDFDQQSRIITSRDADVGKLQTKLKVGGVPDGFEKWSCRFTSVAPRSYLFPLPTQCRGRRALPRRGRWHPLHGGRLYPLCRQGT